MGEGCIENLSRYYKLFAPTLVKWAVIGTLSMTPSCINHTSSLTALKGGVEQQSVIDVSAFGAVGNGLVDDTKALQKALTKCSMRNLVCKVPRGKNFLVRAPLYVWGGAQIIGEDGTGRFTFNAPDVPYLVNVGIRARKTPETPFSGRMAKIRFVKSGGKEGRIGV